MSSSTEKSFSFRLQKGLTSSYASPPLIIELNFIPSEESASSSEQSQGSFLFKSQSKDDVSIKSTDEPKMLDSKDIHKTDLFETLEKLKDLPREEPEGSEDIYGMDYQIFYSTPTFEWVNSGSGGCIASPDSISSIKPTPEQKKTFKEIVDRVLEVSKTL